MNSLSSTKLQCCFAGGMSLQHSLTESLLGTERRRGKQGNLCRVKERVELWEMTGTHHVIAWQKFLQKLSLLVLQGFDDELIIAGQVEERTAGARIGQLDQGLLADWVLCERKGICSQFLYCVKTCSVSGPILDSSTVRLNMPRYLKIQYILQKSTKGAPGTFFLMLGTHFARITHSYRRKLFVMTLFGHPNEDGLNFEVSSTCGVLSCNYCHRFANWEYIYKLYAYILI